jgi:hypothetical protein
LDLKTQLESRPSSLVGLDNNAVSSLLNLMNVLDGDDINNSPNVKISVEQFQVYLEEFFARLDVQQDGNISWWEWRQVLYSAALIRSNILVKFIDHLDPLVIMYLAAHNSTKVFREMDPTIANSLFLDLKTKRQIAWGTDAFSKLGKMSDLVEALRKRNRELEDALSELNRNGDGPEARARIRIAREEAEAAKRLLDAEREKNNRLAALLDGSKRAGDIGKSRAQIEMENRRVY